MRKAITTICAFGVVAAALISGGISSSSAAAPPAIFGTNMGLYDGNEQLLNNAGTRQILVNWHTPVIRMPFRSSLSDGVELQALQAIQSIGARPLVIVHGAVDATVLADDQHLLSLVSQVFGSSTVYVEFGNEEDGAGITASAYTTSWNAVIPTLKAAHPSYQFIGPVTSYADTSYIATFVQGASPAPDLVSWHEYTCGPSDSTGTCFSHISSWGAHASSIASAESAATGRTWQFMVTEWNMDWASDPRYLDSTVIGPWTTQALQELAALVPYGLVGAQQYVAASHDGGFQLIDASNNLTPQGQAFSAALAGTPLPAPSPSSSPSASPSPSPSPSANPSPSQTTSTAPSSPTTSCTGGSAISLSGSQSTSVMNGAYHLQANEWSSSAAFSVTSNGCNQFQVATSGINNATNGAPGAYPSLYRGCHWGNCTSNSGLPLQVSSVESPGAVTTSYDTSVITAGAWDDSYDIWFNPASATSNNSSGLEMMIWLDRMGPVQPAGNVIASNVNIGGRSYTVWHGGASPGGTISFVLTSPVTSVSNLDLGPLAAYSDAQGFMTSSWYLIDIEAGFEPWIGGQGLKANSFSVCDAAGCASSTPSPAPIPAPVPSPSPSPAPSPSPIVITSSGAIHYDFEDGTAQGWGPRWGSITVAGSTAQAYTGTHALAISSTGGYQAVAAKSSGLASGMTITYHVWAPSAVAIEPYATDNAWHNYFAPTQTLNAGWNTVTWTMPAMTAVTAVGLQVNVFTGTVYLDSVTW